MNNPQLLQSASEFLALHAETKVNWQSWNAKTLQKIKNENLPVFLYIGTLSSAWSLTLLNDNFQDTEVSQTLNNHFNCLIVDREEHPDLDFYFANAVQAMTGKNSRPIIAFLTPDLQPFFGGSFFPLEESENVPSMQTVLGNIAELWKNSKGDFFTSAKQIVLKLENSLKPVADLMETAEEDEDNEDDESSFWAQVLYHETYKSLQKIIPEKVVGFYAKGPRFAQPNHLTFLLRYFHVNDFPEAWNTAITIFDKIINSAIYDSKNGGFFRYTSDEKWTKPCPEKSLAENAVLVRALLEAYQITENKDYENAITSTLNFMAQKMRGANEEFLSNGFFTSINHLPAEPIIDRKVVLAENALAISVFCKASTVFNEESYLTVAENAVQFILEKLCKNGELRRCFYNGNISEVGFLEDYAFFVNALLDLYEANFGEAYLLLAHKFTNKMIENFYDVEKQNFYQQAKSQANQFNFVPFADSATPSALSSTISVLWRMQHFTKSREIRKILKDVTENMKATFSKIPLVTTFSISEMFFNVMPILEIVISGDEAKKEFLELSNAINYNFVPNKIFAKLSEKTLDESKKIFPILNNKPSESPAVSFCNNGYADEEIFDASLVELIISPNLFSNE